MTSNTSIDNEGHITQNLGLKVIISQLWGTGERNNMLREEIKTLIEKSSLKFKAVMDGGFIENDDPMLLSYGLIGVLVSSATTT